MTTPTPAPVPFVLPPLTPMEIARRDCETARCSLIVALAHEQRLGQQRAADVQAAIDLLSTPANTGANP